LSFGLQKLRTSDIYVNKVYKSRHIIAMARKISTPTIEDETRSANVAVRLKPSVKKALDSVARGERRTVSALLEIVIETWLKERGAMK
jgi:hypothetical protein